MHLLSTSLLSLIFVAALSVVTIADQTCSSGQPCDLTCNNLTASQDPNFCLQQCTDDCNMMQCSSSGKDCTQICNNNCTALACTGTSCVQECKANCSITACTADTRCSSNCKDCNTMTCSGKSCSMIAESDNVDVTCAATETCELTCIGNCKFTITHASARAMINSCTSGKCEVYCAEGGTCDCTGIANCSIVKSTTVMPTTDGTQPSAEPTTAAPSRGVKLKATTVGLLVTILIGFICCGVIA